MNPIALVTEKVRCGRGPSARSAPSHAARRTGTRRGARRPRSAMAMIGADAHGYVVPPRLVKSDDRRTAHRRGRRRRGSRPCGAASAVRVEDHRDHRERGEAERDVHVEDPAPRGLSTKKPPSSGPMIVATPEDGAEEALVPPAFSRRTRSPTTASEITISPPTEPLDGAERDQLRHVLCERYSADSIRKTTIVICRTWLCA